MLKKFTIFLCLVFSLLILCPQKSKASDTLGIIGTVLGGTALGLYGLNALGYGFGRYNGGGGYYGGGYAAAPMMYSYPVAPYSYSGYGYGYGGSYYNNYPSYGGGYGYGGGYYAPW